MVLKERLLNDLKKLDINDDFSLELRGYSSCRWGYYSPCDKKIVLYPYVSKSLIFRRKYYDLYMSLLHESIHHLQYSDPSFTRFYGVMHDDDFWSMFNHYKMLANERVFKGEIYEECRKTITV